MEISPQILFQLYRKIKLLQNIKAFLKFIYEKKQTSCFLDNRKSKTCQPNETREKIIGLKQGETEKTFL